MPEQSKARIAQNEALYRAINERLITWEERRAAPDDRHLFFCECGHESCDQRLFITIREYERLRADPMRFGLLREHLIPESERVVEEHDGYVVVEKFEEVRDIVEGTDPRS